MSQQLSDLCQRCSLPEHLGGEAMSKLMGPLPWRMNPRSCERMSDKGSDRLRAPEACDGRLTTKKYAAVGCFRPHTSEVVGDSLTDIRRKWQLGIAATLSAHSDPSVLPVEVLQMESYDLTRPQTEPCEKQ